MYKVILTFDLPDEVADGFEDLYKKIQTGEIPIEASQIVSVSAVKFEPSKKERRSGERQSKSTT